MNKQGILTVVSGFSGVGKGTLMKALLAKYDNYALSISATTRSPRDGEVEGVSYFFKEKAEFERLISENELIEYAKYVDNYYGTPKSYVEEQLNSGKDVILEIEIQGALKVKERFPDTLLLFVTAPSATALKERLVGRGTETIEVIESRLCRACEEASGMSSYDYILVNDDLETCVDHMHSIIQNEHNKASKNTAFIKQMQDELLVLMKGE